MSQVLKTCPCIHVELLEAVGVVLNRSWGLEKIFVCVFRGTALSRVGVQWWRQKDYVGGRRWMDGWVGMARARAWISVFTLVQLPSTSTQ